MWSLRGSRQAWPKQSGGGIPIVIPASARESRVVGMTLLSLRGGRQARPKQSGGGVVKLLTAN